MKHILHIHYWLWNLTLLLNYQLNEKTRICFRDALYRLANNSKGNLATQSQDGDQASEIAEPSSWTAQDETIRYIVILATFTFGLFRV